MSKRHWISLALVAVVMIMTFQRKPSPHKASRAVKTDASLLPGAAAGGGAPVTARPERLPLTQTRSSLLEPVKSLTELKPSRDEIRSAALLDPHATPRPLLKFSVAIYRGYKAAEGSESSARGFFAELERCVTEDGPDGVPQVQAICLLNAKRLQRLYPSLRGDYDRMELSASPAALKVFSALPL